MKKLFFLLILISSFGFSQISENFEGASFPPTGWTTFENGTGGSTVNWTSINSLPLVYQGNKAAFLDRQNVATGLAEDWMVTSQFLVPANGQLRFWTRSTQAGNQTSLFYIKVSTNAVQNNTAAYVDVQTYDESTLTVNPLVYEEKVVDLSAYSGQNVYLAFVMTNDNGDRWLVDNINVVERCDAPIALVSNTVTANSANITWTGPVTATQWEIEVVPATSNFGTGTIQTVAVNSYAATGLTPDTDYKYQVRALCASGFYSAWSSTGFFTTMPIGYSCTNPNVITGLPYNTNDNTANYADVYDVIQATNCVATTNNYMLGYDVFYSYTPSFTGTISITSTPNGSNSGLFVYQGCANVGISCLGGVANSNLNPRNIVLNVTAGQNYIIVLSSLLNGTSYGYNLNIQQVNCTPPASLATAGITATSANISWSNPSGATSWEVYYDLLPASLPTGAGNLVVNTNPNTTLNSLISGATYQYYVRANCGNGTFSQWSGPFTFSTLQTPTVLPFSDGFESNTGWTLNNATQLNKWVVGSAVNNGGTKSLYVSNSNGFSNTYTLTSTSISHAYKDFTIPAGTTQISVSFDWRSVGETGSDYLRVWAVPATFTPTTGTAIGANAQRINLTGNLTLNSVFTTFSSNVNVGIFAGSTMRLIFEWRNDSSVGSQTPAAVDNVELAFLTCPAPLSIASAGTPSSSSLSVNWVSGGTESQWEVIILPTGSPAPTALSTGTLTNTNSYTFTGLNSVTCYDVYVRAFCSASDKSIWKLFSNTCTLPDFCNGDHFYDNGGASGNYLNNSNQVVTVCPTIPGGNISVTFNSFDVEDEFDYLKIYNGSNTTAPLLGTYTNTNIPPTMVGTSLSGCLTYEFTSDGSGRRPGWDATVTCLAPRSCVVPTNIQVSNITYSSATFSWTENNPGVTAWQIVILPQGPAYPSSSATVINATSNPFTITGLAGIGKYSFWIRSVCGGANGESIWQGPLNFQTLVPPCSSTQPAGDNCSDATPICSLNGYCGNTSSSYTYDAWNGLINAFSNCNNRNASIQNNSYLKFQAGTTTMNLNVWVGNCSTNSGIQFLLFSTNNCGSGPVNSLYCNFQMLPGYNNLTFTGLVPGNLYYLMIDGFNGDVCDYTTVVVDENSIRGDVQISPLTADVCLNTPFTFNATGGNQNYTWSGNASPYINTTTGSSVVFTPTQLGTYTLNVQTNDTNSLCATSDFVTINVVNPPTPTFTSLTDVCQNTAAPALPLISNNGISGTWSPAVSTANVGTFTYTFTPNAGQCGTTTTLSLNITSPSIVPTFDAINPICQGTTGSQLAAISTNNIQGTWSPATIDTNSVGTSTYTFTPTIGQCAIPTTLNVTVNPLTNPSFTLPTNVCQGVSMSSLPLVSNNGINGVWNPSVIDSNLVGNSTYTFTPNSGQCSTNYVLNVTVNPLITPTFNSISSICQGTIAPSLPTTSLNNINGTWSPSIIDTNTPGTTTYTFTPDVNQCATSTTLNVTVNSLVVPTFTINSSICQGGVAPVLPTQSSNGVNGIWSPSVVNTNTIGTTTYTFTPDAGQCASTTTFNFVVNQPAMPVFTIDNIYCQSSNFITLPSSSNNGVTGSWVPNSIDTSVVGATTYTFTPDVGQCAISFDLIVNVDSAITIAFNQPAPLCAGSGTNPLLNVDLNGNTGLWSPDFNNLQTTDYIFTPDNPCALPYQMTVTIQGCDIPKGISPGGDGKNDYWDLSSFNISDVSIYNRYGVKVYSKTNYTNEWLGQSDSGSELPSGTYYYVITFRDMDSRSGWVYINRENK